MELIVGRYPNPWYILPGYIHIEKVTWPTGLHKQAALPCWLYQAFISKEMWICPSSASSPWSTLTQSGQGPPWVTSPWSVPGLLFLLSLPTFLSQHHSETQGMPRDAQGRICLREQRSPLQANLQLSHKLALSLAISIKSFKKYLHPFPKIKFNRNI